MLALRRHGGAMGHKDRRARWRGKIQISWEFLVVFAGVSWDFIGFNWKITMLLMGKLIVLIGPFSIAMWNYRRVGAEFCVGMPFPSQEGEVSKQRRIIARLRALK